MRIVISSAVKVFYEENDNVFFGNLNNFFAFMEQRTKEYNKITKTEFNSILKSRAQKAVAFPIGYARKIMIDIKNKSNDFFKSITIEDQRTAAKMEVPFVHPYKARDHLQKEAIVSFLKSKRNGHIVAPCGAGKTYMALKIMEVLGEKTCIVVDETMLLDQWKEDIIDLCQYPVDRLGELHGKKKDIENKDILIAMKQTLAGNEEYVKYIADNYGFVVVDECHTAPTEVFTTLLMKLNPRYRLGLTATPERQDGNEYLIDANIGPKIAHLNQRELIKLGSILESIIHPIFIIEKNERLGKDFWDKKLKSTKKIMPNWRHLVDALFDRKKVHDVVTGNIYQKYLEGEHAAVILAETKWIKLYYEKLIALGVKENEIEIIEGKTSKDYRKDVIDRAKSGEIKVILTSKLLDKAISINILNAIHLVFPSKATGNVEQRVGRIARLHATKTSKPVVYDYIFDNYVFFKQLFNIFSFCRMKAYEKTSDTVVVKKLIDALKQYFGAKSIQVREEERKKIIDVVSKLEQFKKHIIVID